MFPQDFLLCQSPCRTIACIIETGLCTSFGVCNTMLRLQGLAACAPDCMLTSTGSTKKPQKVVRNSLSIDGSAGNSGKQDLSVRFCTTFSPNPLQRFWAGCCRQASPRHAEPMETASMTCAYHQKIYSISILHGCCRDYGRFLYVMPNDLMMTPKAH